MALTAKHKEVEFGVGDTIKVTQSIEEAGKKRSQVFEGIVIAIKGRDENKSFTVRRIGAGAIGIERIFPLSSPLLLKVEVARSGTKGVNSAKLYYIRDKSKKEIEKIYARAQSRENAASAPGKTKTAKKRTSVKKSSRK